MKFKVSKSSPLFKKLESIKLKVKEADKAATTLASSLGFNEHYPKRFVLAGGIEAFHKAGISKPDGFAYAYGAKNKEAFFPKKTKANKELLDKIAALPVVENHELNSILKFNGNKSKEFTKTGGRRVCFHPEVHFGKGYFLIGIPEYIDYKPVKGMTEITTSQYHKLSK